MNGENKVGFNKGKLRCFYCHEPGHFARDCLKPNMRENHDKTTVPVMNNKGSTSTNETVNLVVVAQTFGWEDQIQAHNISKPENAHMAHISESPKEKVKEDLEKEMMQLQFAFMVSTTPEPEKKEVSEDSYSKKCIGTVKFLHEKIELLTRENEDLKYEGYNLRKGQKPLTEKLDAKTKDFRKLQEKYSNKCVNYDYVTEQLANLTAELDSLKNMLNNVDFNFRKFDVSSEKVESMIEKQLKFMEN